LIGLNPFEQTKCFFKSHSANKIKETAWAKICPPYKLMSCFPVFVEIVLVGKGLLRGDWRDDPHDLAQVCKLDKCIHRAFEAYELIFAHYRSRPCRMGHPYALSLSEASRSSARKPNLC